MRVLWVTAEPPDSGGGGGNIRQSMLLQAVARAGHDVHLLLAGGEPDDDVRSACASVTLLAVPETVRPADRWAARALELRLAVHGGPSELHDTAAARRALSRAWPDREVDVVLVEHAGLTPLVRHRRGERWACTLHNIASGTARALQDLAPGRRQRLMVARDAQQATAVERRALRDYDSVVTVSDDDAALLPGPSFVVPNGVDLARFTPTPLPAAPRLLFTGTLNYLPNVDGLQWFCREVLPLLRDRVSEAVLDVVGRAPVPEVVALAGDGVQLHRDVPAVQPYLERARVCVVPLRIGTGSRLKALEAMAAGRPVAGTTVGMAGLDLTDQAVVEDDPQRLADALARLLREDGPAQDLAARGRAHAEARFGWDAIGTRLADHLLALSRR